jgi:hypothetical protein
LIDLGATAIVMMPIGFATENHETLLDVHHIVHALKRRSPHVTYVEMPCVNDHPEFLKMAADWANPQIEALLEESASCRSIPSWHQYKLLTTIIITTTTTTTTIITRGLPEK